MSGATGRTEGQARRPSQGSEGSSAMEAAALDVTGEDNDSFTPRVRSNKKSVLILLGMSPASICKLFFSKRTSPNYGHGYIFYMYSQEFAKNDID